MNRVPDAINLLQPAAVGELLLNTQPAKPAAQTTAVTAGGSDDEVETECAPHPTHLYCCEGQEFDHAHLRCQMYVNMAAVMAVQADYTQADRFAQQALAAEPTDQSALLLTAYLYLQRGNKQSALKVLTQHRNASHSAH